MIPPQFRNGKACGCVCPGCGRALIAYNHGRIRSTHYFGHVPGDECAKGLESAIHLAGKQAMVNAKRVRLPALEVSFDGIARFGPRDGLRRVAETATTAVYEEVHPEVSLEVTETVEEPSAQADLFGAEILQGMRTAIPS